MREILAAGFPIPVLADLFGVPHDTARRKLMKCTPTGKDSNSLLYSVVDAAKLFIDVQLDSKALVQLMKKGDMPPALNAEFWRAQLNRQEFEKKAGDLWHTDRVLEAMSSAFKVCRQQIVLFTDTIETQTQLSTEQRKILRTLSDQLIVSLGEALRDDFAYWDGEGDKDDSEQLVTAATKSRKDGYDD